MHGGRFLKLSFFSNNSIRFRGPLTDVDSVCKLDRLLHWHYYFFGHGFHLHGSVYTWISPTNIPTIVLLWLMLTQSGLRCSGTLRILRQKPPQMLFVASSQDMGSLRKLLVTLEYQEFFSKMTSRGCWSLPTVLHPMAHLNALCRLSSTHWSPLHLIHDALCSSESATSCCPTEALPMPQLDRPARSTRI